VYKRQHEIQHHRQWDTRFVYIVEAIRCSFFYNPFAWVLISQVSQLQELACDETLLSRKRVSFFSYSRCLLKAADHQSDMNHQKHYDDLLGAARLSPAALFLKRRLLAMKTIKQFSKLKNCLLGIVVFISFIGVGYASKNLASNNLIIEKLNGKESFDSPLSIALTTRRISTYSKARTDSSTKQIVNKNETPTIAIDFGKVLQASQQVFFIAPIKGLITDRFDPKSDLFTRKPNQIGIDIEVRKCRSVVATAPGTILRAKRSGNEHFIEIQHEDGFLTRYAHMKTIEIEVGRRVKRGELIGSVGSAKHPTDHHLHYEITHNGKNVDPLSTFL